MTKTGLIDELSKVKAMFQQRAILAAMGEEHPRNQCPVCGDYHAGEAPHICQTGDGV